MSQPLSPSVGNALEVATAIEVLTGSRFGRFGELCVTLASIGLALATGREEEAVRGDVEDALSDGSAAERFRALVEAQGGNPNVVDRPREVLPVAPIVGEWRGGGRVGEMDCAALGRLASGLGAGRRHRDQAVDPRVGVEMLVEIGDHVDPDTPIVRVHAQSEDDRDWALSQLPDLISLDGALPSPPLVHARIGEPHV